MPVMPKPPRILDCRTIAQTRIFRIEEIDLEFSNGVGVRYERLVGSGRGAVMLVPMRDAETVLLVREYAAGTERYELGLPKGRIEPDEEMLVAANREMMEEIGFRATHLTLLTTLSLAPCYMGHKTHVVLAEGLVPERAEGDEPEPLEVVPWRLDRIHELIESGECTEARTLAALWLVRDRLEKTSDEA